MEQKLRIVHDDEGFNPREFDNLGVMACWHRRYILGDVQPKEEASEWLKENAPEGSIVLPLFLLDHSGLRISTRDVFSQFYMGMDSGQVGWIVATPAEIRMNFMSNRITKKMRETATKVLIDEVREYDQFLSGETWGYVFEEVEECDKGELHTKVIDSCMRFLGSTLEETGLKHAVPSAAKALLEAAWAARFERP